LGGLLPDLFGVHVDEFFVQPDAVPIGHFTPVKNGMA